MQTRDDPRRKVHGRSSFFPATQTENFHRARRIFTAAGERTRDRSPRAFKGDRQNKICSCVPVRNSAGRSRDVRRTASRCFVARRDFHASGRRLDAPRRAWASHAGGAPLHSETTPASCSSVTPRSKQHRARHVTCHHAGEQAGQADQGVEARRREGCEEGAQGEGGDGVAVHHAQCRAEQASAQARGLPQALHPEGHPSKVRAARVPRPRRVETNARKPSRVARRRRRQQALFLRATCGASQLPASRRRGSPGKTRFSSKRVFR